MNHFISLQQAIDMTTLYRQQKENVLADEYKGTNILAISETFDRAAFDWVLAQAGCTALRIYFGMDASLNIHSIVVGVNSNNEDILPPQQSGTTTTATTDDTGIIEEGNRCPDLCGTASALNP